jgi:hypothetical protein
MPKEERYQLARLLVGEKLAKQRSRRAVLRGGRLLRKHFKKVAPRDAVVFIADLRSIYVFEVKNDGRTATWWLEKVEKKKRKGICRLHFRRVS